MRKIALNLRLSDLEDLPSHNTYDLIHGYIEYSLMRIYARKKIGKRNPHINYQCTSKLQAEIEHALYAISISDIELIWRLGKDLIDDAIIDFQTQFPAVFQTGHGFKNMERVIPLREFSLSLASALFMQISFYRVMRNSIEGNLHINTNITHDVAMR